MKKLIFMLFAGLMMILATTKRAEAQKVIQWPYGAVDAQSNDYEATSAVTISNSFTIVTYASVTGDMTVNITIASGLKAGALVIFKVTPTTNGYDVTWGTGIDAPVMVGVATKTKLLTFVYNGTNLLALGSEVQID